MMAFDTRGLDDYATVAERIAEFREHYPDGSLQPLDLTTPFEIRKVDGTTKEGKDFTATFIIYVAAAYRDRTDARPGIGMAWEVYPGRTPYTLGSELMNAETSAQGRAIVAALAADSKKGVASREEVRNRAAERNGDGGPAYPVTERDQQLISGGRPRERVDRRRGADLNDEQRLEERPGYALPADLAAIGRAYYMPPPKGLGFDRRTDALHVLDTTEKLVGRDLSLGPNPEKTHKNLTLPEAKKLRGELEGFHGDRGQLLERLNGIRQAAEQDAAEGSQETPEPADA